MLGLFDFLSVQHKICVYTDTQGFVKSAIEVNENHNLKIKNISFDKSSIGLIKNIKYLYSFFQILKQKSSKHTIFISNKLILIGAILNIIAPLKKRNMYFFFSGLGY